MNKIILLNRIVADGFGDFAHLTDIYCYLRDLPGFERFELIPVICCDDSPLARNQFDKIHQKLQSLAVPVYFLGNESAYKRKLSRDPVLIQCFSEAVQIINISYIGIFGIFDALMH